MQLQMRGLQAILQKHHDFQDINAQYHSAHSACPVDACGCRATCTTVLYSKTNSDAHSKNAPDELEIVEARASVLAVQFRATACMGLRTLRARSCHEGKYQ
mgnify:CR=1 FL=1